MDLKTAYRIKSRQINSFAIDVADTINLTGSTSIISCSLRESMLIAVTVAHKIVTMLNSVSVIIAYPTTDIKNAFIIKTNFDYYNWIHCENFRFNRFMTDSVPFFTMVNLNTDSTIYFINLEERHKIINRIDAYWINICPSGDDWAIYLINSARGIELGKMNIFVEDNGSIDKNRSEKACDLVTRITRQWDDERS